ncbi:AbrB/MazE/SpoVT family DNA-binding domain-containing protein [Ferrovibrio sp.]|uniref:AbrB/MazE/SpoVT family DNA-binding domain-containing protein n=1 Tax=Ferrovibrio sp. TaxID=1917215 RepID=UPI0025BAA7F0|nr:AbrB/MazE/SpoVT family DNA-binding domain-containing protein [Ferrovibrio sp.]MBX3453554.1 AbrB/MazE/SpoVT family DNA-binding domain-containing protein [Ferrovibrio sp.]
MLCTSRLTSKSQTVLPKEVREALGLKPGDLVGYRIEGRKITLVPLQASDEVKDDPFATFSEWASETDAKGYASL